MGMGDNKLNQVEVDMAEIRLGIREAALAHDAKIKELQAELLEAYRREKEILTSEEEQVDKEFHALVLTERQRFSQELYTARRKLDGFRKKLEETQEALAEAELKLSEAGRRFSVLSASRLGSIQLKYWRWRNRKRNN